MRQRSSAIGATSSLKVWFQRFSFVLLTIAAFGVLLIGKADTVMLSRLRIWVADSIGPVIHVVSAPVETARDTASDVQSYFSLKQQVEALARQNQALQDYEQQARNLKAENESLRALLKMTPNPRISFISAPVIADASSGFVRGVIALAGRENGVVKGQAAMVGNGLVGRVQDVGDRVSRVMLLTDINSRLPILIERTRDQAVLAGNNSDLPDINYLPRDADIKIGDHVVTSGIGGAFPPGLPVGEVAEVSDGKVYVQPFADLGRLEFIRMVDYGLPGILSEDLGVDTAKQQTLRPPSAAVQAPMPPKPATTQPKLKPAEGPAVEQ
ncbi:MAG TPA: rod shape-determining protein MreC [Dongiaceae bacterium]|nr:rod shape-determining protein MreC [Dongiaceae bacterium]